MLAVVKRSSVTNVIIRWSAVFLVLSVILKRSHVNAQKTCPWQTILTNAEKVSPRKAAFIWFILTFLSSIASLEAAVNESCFFNEQCEVKYFQTECRDGRCVCRFDMTPIWLKDGSVECKGKQFAEFSSMRNGQECPHLSQHSISYADDR